MLKHLPVNLKNRASNISFAYEFPYGNDKSSNQLFINPLVIVGFPLSMDSFKMAGNLRFFSLKGELKISSICVSSTSRNLFKNTNFTLHRKDCIEKIRQNLGQQIDQLYSQGAFNVFKD